MTAMNIERNALLNRIRSSIDRRGYHIYVISGNEAPRYAYTIGLYEKLGLELVFAGGYYFSINEVQSIIYTAAAELLKENHSNAAGFKSVDFGYFKLNPVDPSWSRFMLLAAFDFYNQKQIRAIQICPTHELCTIDIPDMTNEWESSSGPIWKSLGSGRLAGRQKFLRATTNLAVLRGEKVTEAARWEDDDWELFAGNGPDVLPGDVRVVPLNLLLAVDPTLEEIANLEIGQARWREAGAIEWHPWN